MTCAEAAQLLDACDRAAPAGPRRGGRAAVSRDPRRAHRITSMRCICSASRCTSRGATQAAVTSIERALAVEPRDPAAHSNLALALRDLGRLDEALASLDRALSHRVPITSQALNNRGNVLRAMNRHAEALASYDRALAIKPDHAGAHRNRGDVLLELNRPQRRAARRSIDCSRCSPTTPSHGTFAASPWATSGVTRTRSRATTARLRSLRNSAKREFNRGSAFLDLKRYAAAARRVRRSWLRARPTTRSLADNGCTRRCSPATGTALDALAAAIVDDVRAGRRVRGAVRLPGDRDLARRSEALRGRSSRERAFPPRRPSGAASATTIGAFASATCPASSASRRRRCSWPSCSSGTIARASSSSRFDNGMRRRLAAAPAHRARVRRDRSTSRLRATLKRPR